MTNQTPEPAPAPSPEVPLLDPGNPHLGPDYPTTVSHGLITTPAGQRMLTTWRVGPATLSVTMTRDTAVMAYRRLLAEAEAMSTASGLYLPPGAGNGRVAP